jgi:hypothetical protein
MATRFTSKARSSLALCGLSLVIAVSGWAQEKTQAPASPSSCSRENALEIIQQQVDLSKTFDDDVRRIAVLLRAADLIWPYQQEKARATFADAFEVAGRQYKEKGDKAFYEGRLIVGVPDQRYTVISAIAKRDPVWAGKLSKQIVQEEADEARDKATKDARQDARTGEKLLGVAFSLLASDQATAISFAKSSLSYPAMLELPIFLYKLSDVSRVAADQFYQEALIAYAHAPMAQFLYLSSYPFGRNREVGEMPGWTYYAVPAGFKPNPLMQRLFMLTLFARARELVQNPVAPEPGTRWSEASQIFMALTRLEPEVATSLPDLSAAMQELKGTTSTLLSQQDQQRAGETMADPPPKKSFDEQVEAADKLADAARREGQIGMALLNVSDAESLEQIEAAAAKIDDLALRVKILSNVYFNRAQRALKEKKIDEARRLAAKVDELDQRAYLYAQIVTESIKQKKNDAQAREMLEEVLDAVAKAPNTEIKARAQVAVAYLYSTFDQSRAIAVLGEAVKTINRVESINLSSDSVNKRIEGKAFGRYTTLRTPGFSPETAFREIGKVDLDGTLYLASNLTDKSLRAMTTLALVEHCLKDQAPITRPGQSKPAPSKP